MATKSLTTAEAGKLLGLYPETVRKYCSSGQIRAKKISRDWFISPYEIKRFQARRKQKQKVCAKQG